MLYKPKYCCNCGEEIERAEWRIWHSRRFCILCETEFKPHELLPKIAAAAALLVGIAGFSSYFSSNTTAITEQGSGSPQIRTLRAIDAGQKSSESEKTETTKASFSETGDFPQEVEDSTGTKELKTTVQAKPETFTCGAPTRKGTACTRKVKQRGYCWQHKNSDEALTPPRPKAEF